MAASQHGALHNEEGGAVTHGHLVLQANKAG